ncbi:MAG TPA: hypothetical protein VG410_07425 [Solirubrobacteraceae bacterium]|jgi:hypothetical protein|nr:hypothetical protein [Solirubrobacteraceae bacterium]
MRIAMMVGASREPFPVLAERVAELERAGLDVVASASHVGERLEAYRQAGVTTLLVQPIGPDPVATIAQLRELL